MGLVGELFRIAFERCKTFDVSRTSALPWRYDRLEPVRSIEGRRSARTAASEPTRRSTSRGTVVIALWVPYLTMHGISTRQFMELQAVIALVILSGEVPSGLLSDLWGRKR